jgi:NADH-quinone oxidoreductase subunit A
MKSYLNILVFLFFSGLLSIFLLTLSYVLAIKNYTFEKVSAYECGFEPFNNSRGTFNIQFFIIGILFMIFDLEIAFLFP